MALDPLRHALPNRIVILVKENPTTPAVSMLAAVRAGAFDDPPDGDGTAALVARVLDRGTTSRGRDAIADELDRRGAALSVSAGRHTIQASATCLAEDFADILSLVGDVVRRPAFPDQDVLSRRAELATTIRQAEDDPASVAVERFMAERYANHPYARRIRGTVAAVERLTRADLDAFHRARFGPEGLVIVVVGDVRAAEVIDRVTRELEDWAPSAAGASGAAIPAVAATAGRRLVAVPMMSKAQADLAYGFAGIRRSDSRYYEAAVMNNALGQYALGGRLGDSIRERQGMAYYVSSQLEAGLGEGPLLIRAGVSAANVDKTIASIDRELTEILTAGLTRKEVDDSKRFMIGSLPRQLETNGAIAAFLLNAEVYGLGLDFDVQYPALIGAVTHEDANAAARRLFDPSRATIAVAGPWSAPSSSTSTSP